MTKTKKHYSADFKLKAVLEVLKGEKTATKIASDLGVHPVALSEWKRQFTEGSSLIFSKGKKSNVSTDKKLQAELFEQIGRLKMENEWLKKKLGS